MSSFGRGTSTIESDFSPQTRSADLVDQTPATDSASIVCGYDRAARDFQVLIDPVSGLYEKMTTW